jgi:hypothetical protein
MSAYAATARIERVAPRLVIGQPRHGHVGSRVIHLDVPRVDVAALVDGDPLLDRLVAIRERWSQLTFFLFNAEGWR